MESVCTWDTPPYAVVPTCLPATAANMVSDILRDWKEIGCNRFSWLCTEDVIAYVRKPDEIEVNSRATVI